MGTTITPTVSSFRWGPELHQVASYKAHPTRDPVGVATDWRNAKGNPVLVIRHGGAGTTGNHLEMWDAAQPFNALFQYLIDPARAVHFDIISAETGQRAIYDSAQGAPGIRRARKMFLLEGATDHQRMIASLKFWARRFNNSAGNVIDPRKFVSAGHSFGATQAAISMFSGPLVMPFTNRTGLRSAFETESYDSSVLGLLFMAGQVDCRKINGTNYLNPTLLPGWTGTSNTDATEFDGVSDFQKEAMSVRAWAENGDRGGYAPMYINYETLGAHTYPLADPHDSQQGIDLKASLDAAGLDSRLDIWSAPSHAMTPDVVDRIYQWLAGLVDSGWRTAAHVP
jgi:hypothetical protein